MALDLAQIAAGRIVVWVKNLGKDAAEAYV